MFFSPDVFTIFIHSLLRGRYSLILWILKTAFSDSLILPQQVKTYSGGYLAHGVEGIGGMPYTDGRRSGCSDGSNMFSVESCQFTSGAYHFSDAPLFSVMCILLRRWSSGRSPAEGAGSAGSLHSTERSEQWSVEETIWARSELIAVYWKHRFLLHVTFQSGLQRVKAKVPFPPIPSPSWAS